MTYTGEMLNDLTQTTAQVQDGKEVIKPGRIASDLHFENNSALRTYLISLAAKILVKSSEPTDSALPLKEFAAELNRKMGMADAAEMIRQEAAELRRMSYEEYGS